jgi:hypothetical protein
MKIALELIPDKIVEQYNLLKIAYKEIIVFVKINKGMYGLPQAGILVRSQSVSQFPHQQSVWLPMHAKMKNIND